MQCNIELTKQVFPASQRFNFKSSHTGNEKSGSIVMHARQEVQFKCPELGLGLRLGLEKYLSRTRCWDNTSWMFVYKSNVCCTVQGAKKGDAYTIQQMRSSLQQAYIANG